MKIWKKTLALLLVLALGAALAGCGSFEARMTKAAVKMSKAESAHVDMDLKMGMTLSVLGQDVTMDMTGAMALDVQKEPAVSKGEVTVSALGVEQQALYYTEQAGGETVTYLSQDGGESWSKQSSPAGERQSAAGGLAALKLLADVADSFEEAGEENVDGAAAWRYDGTLEGAFLAGLLEQSGSGETLEQTTQGLFSIEDLRDLEGIPVSIWIDKSAGTISRMDLDLSELMDVVTDRLMEELAGQMGLVGAAVELTVSSVTVSARLSQIDRVGPIQVPDQVRAAAD